MSVAAYTNARGERIDPADQMGIGPRRPMTAGRDLRVGDMMRFLSKWHRVTELRPYTGPLAYLWADEGGARLATWEDGAGMLIEPTARIEVA